ncbi:MAG: methyltransferase domain-containing protein [Hyphomicrobiaceae bacterium]
MIVPDSVRASDYYNTASTSAFYQRLWGGSDIHIGLYATGSETVAEASAAMTRHLISQAGLRGEERVLDIGCGFGGTLRILSEMGCDVSGIDISDTSIEYARKANIAAGFGDAIAVSVGDFHKIDSAADQWDAVICQESLIHSPDRPRVFEEVKRVLRPGGTFVISDIMRSSGADLTRVQAAFNRLRTDAGATPQDYTDMARNAGFFVEIVEERPGDIARHYDRLAEALGQMSDSEFEAVADSISKWQSALATGDITWACIVVRKPV